MFFPDQVLQFLYAYISATFPGDASKKNATRATEPQLDVSWTIA